jgi:peptidoglycan/xylan/chitin deacetylase (PgdA/CDA1 family)
VPYSLQSASLRLGHALGLTRVVGNSAWRRRRLLILCYHGISLGDEHVWNPRLFMSVETFQRRMQVLHDQRCTVLGLDEAIRRVHSGDLPERAVVLTFDDAYRNFLVQAWPVLQRFGFPATVYIPTLRCEHNLPVVQVTVSYMMWKRRGILKGAGIPGLLARDYPLNTETDRAAVLADLAHHDEHGTMTPADKDEQVRRVVEALGSDYDSLAEERRFTLLNPSEVKQLTLEGVDFELHTHRHRTPESPALFLQEVEENRLRLEAITGRPARHFCYPSGICRPGYPALLRNAGVVTATTTRPGLVDAASDPLQLCRFVDSNTLHEREFMGWLHGLAPWLRERRHALGTGGLGSLFQSSHL